MEIKTPYYLISEKKLTRNLKIIQSLKKDSGAKVVLALKCFSTWSLFDLIGKYLDGTTRSSLYETRLGKEKFKKEVHAYSVGFTPDEVNEAGNYADKFIFNSVSQLKLCYPKVRDRELGLRINPGVSFSDFYLADPNRKYSRLGVIDKKSLKGVLPLISGLMFHFNCENTSFTNFTSNLKMISRNYGDLLKDLKWLSLGGGIHFSKNGYPLKKLSQLIRDFSRKYKIQIYLEPGEAVVTNSAELHTRVVDIVHNRIDIAIVDSSVEAHMLDLLIYGQKAKIDSSGSGAHKYMIAGRSCLAGDIFGTYSFKTKLKVGSLIKISDAAGYTMVKKNWFNGLNMPSIVIKKMDGSKKVIRKFSYKDFLESLS